MLLVIRSRFPRIANVLSFVSGVIFLAIGIAAGASPTVLILGSPAPGRQPGPSASAVRTIVLVFRWAAEPAP